MGVEVHKSFCQTAACTESGEIIEERRIKNERRELEEFFKKSGMRVAVE